MLKLTTQDHSALLEVSASSTQSLSGTSSVLQFLDGCSEDACLVSIQIRMKWADCTNTKHQSGKLSKDAKRMQGLRSASPLFGNLTLESRRPAEFIFKPKRYRNSESRWSMSKSPAIEKSRQATRPHTFTKNHRLVRHSPWLLDVQRKAPPSMTPCMDSYDSLSDKYATYKAVMCDKHIFSPLCQL